MSSNSSSGYNPKITQQDIYNMLIALKADAEMGCASYEDEVEPASIPKHLMNIEKRLEEIRHTIYEDVKDGLEVEITWEQFKHHFDQMLDKKVKDILAERKKQFGE
jgi:hypothetical protein